MSQTAHLLALFGVFLDVGVKLGVNPPCSRSSCSSRPTTSRAITPQGSSANLLFAGSGYLSQGDLYRLGRDHDRVSLLVYLVVGTGWLWLVVR